jgi:hypothetical protein
MGPARPPCYGITVSIKATRDFGPRPTYRGEVAIRNTRGPLQLKGPAQLFMRSNFGANPLSATANCSSSSVDPNSSKSCTFAVPPEQWETLSPQGAPWNWIWATVEPSAGGTCNSVTQAIIALSSDDGR